MAYLKLVLLGLALVGLLGVALFNIAIAVLSREVPNLPLNVRINPFNVVAHRDQWTPEMRSANSWATKASFLFVASILAQLGVALLDFGH